MGVFASVSWLAAAAAGKSSVSLFPQDAVACRVRAAAGRLRHERRRRRFPPHSLLLQEVCEGVGFSRSGGAIIRCGLESQREKTDQLSTYNTSGSGSGAVPFCVTNISVLRFQVRPWAGGLASSCKNKENPSPSCVFILSPHIVTWLHLHFYTDAVKQLKLKKH